MGRLARYATGLLLGIVSHDRLDLQELLEPVLTPFATDPRLFVAAEGRMGVRHGAVEMVASISIDEVVIRNNGAIVVTDHG